MVHASMKVSVRTSPLRTCRARGLVDTFVDKEHVRCSRALLTCVKRAVVSEAEDLAQESAFHEALGQRRGPDQTRSTIPSAYLFRVALNGFRMRRRRARMAIRRHPAPPEQRDGYLEAEMRCRTCDGCCSRSRHGNGHCRSSTSLGYPAEQAASILRSERRRYGTCSCQGRKMLDERRCGMPDLREVFQMSTQKVRPDRGFTERQEGRQRRRTRNRKTARTPWSQRSP